MRGSCQEIIILVALVPMTNGANTPIGTVTYHYNLFYQCSAYFHQVLLPLLHSL